MRTFFIALFFILVFSCQENPVQQCPAEDTDKLRVLFIGNSYTEMGDVRLPDLFAGLVKASGKELFIGKAVAGGMNLHDHSTSIVTEEAINMYYWDYVILQGSSITIMFPDSFNIIFPSSEYPPLETSLLKLKEKIKSHRSCTKIIFVIPWAYEDGIAWLEGRSEDYFEMQTRIIENGIKMGKRLDMICAPAGKAYETIMKENHEPHYLFLPDKSHPSLRGSYLTACVLYSTIYKDSVSNNRFTGDIDASEAAHFQDVATETVLKDPGNWNLK